MAENDNDVEEQLVVVVDDEPVTKTSGVAVAPTDPVEDIKEQHAVLQQQVGNERARADAADQRVADVEAQLRDTNSKVIDGEIAKVEGGLTAAEAEMTAAETELASAYEAGKFTDVAKLQGKIGRLGGKIATLERDKARLDEIKKDPTIITGRQPQQPTQRSSDPVESFIQGRTAPTAKWLREHTDYITDAAKQNSLTAAHYDALAKGQVPDSPAYFTHVEKFLGIGQQQGQTVAKTNGSQPQKIPAKPAAPVAPVGPGAGTNPGGSKEVRLTKGEAERATDGTLVWNYDDPSGKNRFKKGDPIGVQEMAQRKSAMQSSGQYDRVYVES